MASVSHHASIVVRLEGGLGNQMFQYAAARAVALLTGRRLLIDPSGIPRGPSGRRYELPAFRIGGEPVRPLMRAQIRGQVGARLPGVVRTAARAVSRRRWTLLRDAGRGCDERLFTVPGDLVLEGAWQSAAYADRDPAVAAQLRRDFALRQQLPDRLAAIAAEITMGDSVGVHVRRGDYVTDPAIAAVHGVQPAEYYAAAAEVIASRASAPRFFVFSDDVAWAEGHLRFPGPTRFVRETAGLRPAIDQRLLASCRHFVIANSTFSWWAAWLGLAPDKMVVVPRKWFAGAEPPTGMIPATWMTSGSPGR